MLKTGRLFSAVTSTFITQVQPELRPDPNDGTVALLRVLLHKIGNTTFGGDVPALPQWTCPPRTTAQVQCLLYVSLATSIFPTFLTMLGKQRLNRSVDMRGSTIERSQDRQRKLDGVIVWYFDHVMESLPLMLQAALLCWVVLWLSIPVGDRRHCRVRCPWSDFVRCSVLPSRRCYSVNLRELPISTPWTNAIRRAIDLSHSAYAARTSLRSPTSTRQPS